ncbi:MAG: oligosaccharide flippase family protein [Planctomycetes bacterium]|nr:oligosaccharide flippase family protein [Planctomycetota bacterium]
MSDTHQDANPTDATLFDKFRKLGRHGVVYGLGSSIRQLAAFLLIPLYTNALSPAEYGVVGLVTLVGLVAGVVFEFGLRTSLFRSMSDHKDEATKNAVFSTALLLTAFGGLLLTGASFLLAPKISMAIFDHTDHSRLLIYVCATTAMDLLSRMALAMLRAQERSAWFTVLQVATLLARIGAIVYFVVYRSMGVEGVFLGQIIAMGASTLLVLFAVRRSIAFNFVARDAVAMLRFGAPLVMAGLFTVVLEFVDQLFLEAYGNLSDVGIYTLAYQIGRILSFGLHTPVRLTWTPLFFAVKDDDNLKPFCAKALTYVYAVGGMLFLAVALLSKELLVLMSEAEYQAAYPLIPIVAFSYLLWSGQPIIEAGVLIRGRTGWSAWYMLFGAIVNVALVWVLIPAYGVYGAAAATLGSFGATHILSMIINWRLFPIAYEWSRLALVFLVQAAVFGTGIYAASPNLWWSITCKVGLILCYPFLLWAVGFFRRDEIIGMRRLIDQAKGRKSN